MFDMKSKEQEQGEKQFVDQQLRMHSHMKSKREPYEDFMSEVCNMFTPELYMRPESTRDKGKRWGDDIWDGYPQLALHTWSKGIPGNMIYPEEVWATMKINVRSLMNDPAIKTYCEARTEQVFWGTKRTNFRDINPQFCRYAGAIGSYLFPIINKEKRSVYFHLEDPYYVWVERDIFGKISRVHREFESTLQALIDNFGEEALHNNRRSTYQNDPYAEVKILHCTFPNPDWDTQSLDASRKPYINCYIDIGMKHLLNQDGIDFMPIDWCVERSPRSTYPLTPAMFALTDAYGGDTISHSLYRVALEAADPEMRISDSLRDRYSGGPGGKTWITDPGQQIIEQVRKMNQWPVSDKERERLNSKIDWWFSVEYWRMLSNIQGQMPTAYHIQQLQSEKATLLGPQVSTYTAQVLDPATDIVSQIEAEYDPIPMPEILLNYLANQAMKELQRLGYADIQPEHVIEFANKFPAAFLEAKYTGVLTSIQGQLVNTRKYGDGLQAMKTIMDLWPEARTIVNPYPVTKHILEAANWSESDVRPQDEWEKIVGEMQKREDLVQQAEMEKASSDTYRNMVKAPEKGSPAAAMSGSGNPQEAAA